MALFAYESEVMLIVSLRSVNFVFWSHLYVMEKTSLCLALKAPFRVAHEEILEYILLDVYIFNLFYLLDSDKFNY